MTRMGVKYMRIWPKCFTLVPMSFRLGHFLKFMVEDLRNIEKYLDFYVPAWYNSIIVGNLL